MTEVTDKPAALTYAGTKTPHHDVHTFFDNDPFPASHFEDADQQKEAATLGMWAFLATEVMLFGGLFLVYTVYRRAYWDGFAHGSARMDLKLGTINTFVLLFSSFAVVMAIWSIQTGRIKATVAWLVLTIAMGLSFLGIKYFEWEHDYHEGLIPWIGWSHEKQVKHVTEELVRPAAERLVEKNPGMPMEAARASVAPEMAPKAEKAATEMRLFFVIYFIMTSTHAIHMIVGMAIIGVFTYRVHKGRYGPHYYTPIEMSGLYWHFVDVVWVFLVPALYLIHRTGF